jgi:flagellar basal body-associated protein FliL
LSFSWLWILPARGAMFKIIKFFFFLFLLLGLGYVAIFFFTLKPEQKAELKEQAILAIKSEDVGIFFSNLREKMKADILCKKRFLLELAKEKLKK